MNKFDSVVALFSSTTHLVALELFLRGLLGPQKGCKTSRSMANVCGILILVIVRAGQ